MHEDKLMLSSRLLQQLDLTRMRVRFLPPRHPSVQEAVVSTLAVLHEMLRNAATVVLILRVGEFYIDGLRMPKESLRFAALREALERVKIHSIAFLAGVEREALTQFCEQCFVQTALVQDSSQLHAFLARQPFGHLRVNQEDLIHQTAVQTRLSTPLAHAREVYQHAVRATVEAQYDSVHGSGTVDVQMTLHIVDMLQNGILNHPNAYFAISQLREFSEYTYYHSVNVAIISMLLGKGVGLDREAVQRLGLAAMLHDLGKLYVPQDVLEKPGRLDDKERSMMEAHPVDSVRILLAQKETCPAALAVAAQHHARYDLSGYPDFRGFGPLHFFSHITTIADVYDALRSARSYKAAMLPDKAMDILLQGAGKDFHPSLFKAFFRMLGLYPVGSAVELNTGEFAVVTRTNPLAPLAPEVRITGGWDRRSADRTVDLHEENQFSEQPREVLRSIDPAAYGIRVTDYL